MMAAPEYFHVHAASAAACFWIGIFIFALSMIHVWWAMSSSRSHGGSARLHLFTLLAVAFMLSICAYLFWPSHPDLKQALDPNGKSAGRLLSADQKQTLAKGLRAALDAQGQPYNGSDFLYLILVGAEQRDEAREYAQDLMILFNSITGLKAGGANVQDKIPFDTRLADPEMHGVFLIKNFDGSYLDATIKLKKILEAAGIFCKLIDRTYVDSQKPDSYVSVPILVVAKNG